MAKIKNKEVIREAMQLTCDITLRRESGELDHGTVGDWMVKDRLNKLYIVKAALFHDYYILVDEERE